MDALSRASKTQFLQISTEKHTFLKLGLRKLSHIGAYMYNFQASVASRNPEGCGISTIPILGAVHNNYVHQKQFPFVF